MTPNAIIPAQIEENDVFLRSYPFGAFIGGIVGMLVGTVTGVFLDAKCAHYEDNPCVNEQMWLYGSVIAGTVLGIIIGLAILLYLNNKGATASTSTVTPSFNKNQDVTNPTNSSNHAIVNISAR